MLLSQSIRVYTSLSTRHSLLRLHPNGINKVQGLLVLGLCCPFPILYSLSFLSFVRYQPSSIIFNNLYSPLMIHQPIYWNIFIYDMKLVLTCVTSVQNFGANRAYIIINFNYHFGLSMPSKDLFYNFVYAQYRPQGLYR